VTWITETRGIPGRCAVFWPRQRHFSLAQPWDALHSAIWPTDPAIWAPANPHVKVIQAPDEDLNSLPVASVSEALKRCLGKVIPGIPAGYRSGAGPQSCLHSHRIELPDFARVLGDRAVAGEFPMRRCSESPFSPSAPDP